MTRCLHACCELDQSTTDRFTPGVKTTTSCRYRATAWSTRMRRHQVWRTSPTSGAYRTAIGMILSSVCPSVRLSVTLLLWLTSNEYILQQKCMNKWIGNALLGRRFCNFQPPTPNLYPQNPTFWTTNIGAIWQINSKHTVRNRNTVICTSPSYPLLFPTTVRRTQYDRLF